MRMIGVPLGFQSSRLESTPVNEAKHFANRPDFPLLRDDADLGLFVAGFHFHTAPIFLRCPSTRAASVATSSVSCGSGVA